jgi:hypothetical protein
MRRTIPLALVLLLASVLVSGQGTPAGLAELLAPVETDEARLVLRDEVLEGELWRLEGMRVAPVYQRLYGTTVTTSIRELRDVVEIELRVSAPGRASPRGTFVLSRSRRDGSALGFRITTREERGCYIEVAPAEERSVLSLYFLGSSEPLYRDVIVPVAFAELVTSSIARIAELTAAVVDWSLIFYQGWRSEDGRVEALARSIAKALPTLRDADDGAIDEKGRFVFISTLEPQPGAGGLNCSGFVKWVVDGYYYALRGRNISVAEAARKDEEARGSSLADSLEALDPYFGLDWTRNLAVILDSARHPREARADVEAFDLRTTETVPYVEDIGYPMDSLWMLLYRRTMAKPGEFYLGSVNDTTGPGGLRQHYHTLVLLPYFDAGGVFRVRIFERMKESGLDALAARYPGAYIHLVRAAAEGTFAPLDVP